MSQSREQDWRQIRFVSPEGRVEVLWAESAADSASTYRILNAPVWVYNISIGTIVEGRGPDDRILDFVHVLDRSAGGTVRIIALREGAEASRLYLERILADCQRRGIPVGPATFFNPRLVAIHVPDWQRSHDALFEYLEELAAAGDIQEWESADPAEPSDEPPEPARPGPALVHPRPTPPEPYV